MFELLECGPVVEIPMDTPLSEEQAWVHFRDLLKGIEYRMYHERNLKISIIYLAIAVRLSIGPLTRHPLKSE